MNHQSPHADAVNGSRDGPAGPSPVPGPSRMRQVLDAIPPASGAVVMASGIVSIDLYAGHRPVLSAVMLWFTAGVWLLLAVMLGMRLAHQRDRFAREAGSPGAFTGVAGTAVLGTRLVIPDYRVAAAALLAVSVLCWALLVVPVLRHWQTPTAGVSFVLVAATESLAVLGADLAVSYRAGWLASAAAAALVLGLAFYVFTAARFDPRDLLTGHGDQWVAGGALAICALAAGHVTQAAAVLGQFSGQHQALTTSTLVLWCLAMVWLPPLITGEILRPRPGYDVRRWATVFPLGIYAASSFTTGQVTGITGITRFGQGWTWVAFTGWLLALAGLIRHGWPVLRGQHRPAAQPPSQDGGAGGPGAGE
jgi:tellurite resistance protein TehA-like permease